MGTAHFMRRYVAFLAGAAVAAAACASRPVVDRPARVALFGDSILAESDPRLVAAFTADGWIPFVDGHGGTAMSGGPGVPSWPVEMQRQLQRFRPNVVVVELGTNGCSCGNDLDHGIDTVMDVLRGVRRVYWVNVRQGAPTPDDAVAINKALDRAVDRWRNLHVIDMNRRFRNAPQLIDTDRVHLNPSGVEVFTQLILDALPKVRAT